MESELIKHERQRAIKEGGESEYYSEAESGRGQPEELPQKNRGGDSRRRMIIEEEKQPIHEEESIFEDSYRE